MELDSVVDRPLAADSTRDTFPLMPLARLLMKSGIQVCMSTRGPVSGTEKCRQFRIALATVDAAFLTLSIAPLIPEAMLPTRSEPQDTAEEITPLTADFALVKAFVIEFLMLAALLLIVETMLWKVEEIEVFRLFAVLVTLVFSELTVLVTLVFSEVHAVVTDVFRLVMAVVTEDFSPFQAVVTLVFRPFTVVDTLVFRLVHAVDTAVFKPIIVVETEDFRPFHAVVTIAVADEQGGV